MPGGPALTSVTCTCSLSPSHPHTMGTSPDPLHQPPCFIPHQTPCHGAVGQPLTSCTRTEACSGPHTIATSAQPQLFCPRPEGDRESTDPLGLLTHSPMSRPGQLSSHHHPPESCARADHPCAFPALLHHRAAPGQQRGKMPHSRKETRTPCPHTESGDASARLCAPWWDLHLKVLSRCCCLQALSPQDCHLRASLLVCAQL